MDQWRVRITRIAIGLEPHLVSPSQHLLTRINWKEASLSMGRGLLIIAWGITQWVRHFIKSQSHLLGELTRLGFPTIFHNQRSPSTMEGLTLPIHVGLSEHQPNGKTIWKIQQKSQIKNPTKISWICHRCCRQSCCRSPANCHQSTLLLLLDLPYYATRSST